MRRGRRNSREMPRERGPRVNDRIRVPRVLLIDETGRKLGVFLTEDAIEVARTRGLDLIEVAPDGRPPVCRIADFGKLKYEKKKRQAAARKTQTTNTIKELKVRPKTDDHDMEVKIGRARKFLENGDKVKITVWFRGREHAHHDIGADQCLRIAEACKDLGRIISQPKMDGRRMNMLLEPLKD